MESLHAPVSERLEEAGEAALEGDWPTALRLAREADRQWEKNRRVTAAMADHSPMDETDSLFAEMRVWAQARDDAHFAACCAQLALMTRSMAENHSFLWWNFL